MDKKIRSLLASSESDVRCLDEAFELLQSNESRPAIDGPDLFSHDLFVLCAESAILKDKPLMARDALKMYFGRIPPQNQFLGRAYLAQAQLLAPESAENVDQLEKAVVFLLRAIKFAKENSRYHFIVYNASVLYWNFCRPFLRKGYKKYLAPSLLMVSRALDETRDSDYEWRSMLMIALIESLLEAGKYKDAIDVSTNAASFTKRHVPHLFKEIFKLQILHDLVELPFLYRTSRASGDLNCFYRIYKFRAKSNRGDFMSDPKGRLSKCLEQIMNRALDEEEDDEEESAISDAGRTKLGRKPQQRPVSKVTKKSTAGPSFNAPQEQALAPVEPDQQPALLIDMFRLCMDYNYLDLAGTALEDLKRCTALSKSDEVELEILDSELILARLGDMQESFRKDIVQLREKLISRIEQAIVNAVRLDNRDLVQAACTTLWNICLPMLQPNLRSRCRRALTLIASTLEDIQSLLRLMRCQVHTELAKCEEDVEQNQVALEHIHKAMALDDDAVYLERHENSLQRLEMRITLYQTPSDPIQLATQIIEQASSTGSGTMTMRRAHLMKAGQALSPDSFILVMEAENFTKVLAAAGGAGRGGVLTVTGPLGQKALHYNTYMEKTAGHLSRMGNEQDRVRVRLWADLARTARKQGVWDICRVACRFCLLYDDNRWKLPSTKEEPPKKKTRKGSQEEATKSGAIGEDGHPKGAAAAEPPDSDSEDRRKEQKSSDDEDVQTVYSGPIGSKGKLYDRDLIREMAEVRFLYGEALIQLLRQEGLELNDSKPYPDDKSKRPKGYVPPKPEEDKNWIQYTNWTKNLSNLATNSFLRGAELGAQLEEAWIVQSATAYLWNYNNHVLTNNRHNEVVKPFETLFELLKDVGFENKTPLLVNLCTALATGLILPYLPREAARPNTASTIRRGEEKTGKKGASGAPAAAAAPTKKEETTKVTIDAKGQEDIRKAVAVCEFAIKTTNGEVAKNDVPIAVRQPLLEVWVRAKQLISSAIGKGLGCEEDDANDGQKLATRVLVALQMADINNNGLYEFKECPNTNEMYSMASACKWTDRNVALQSWTRLAHLAYDQRDFNLALKMTDHAFEIEDQGYLLKLKKNDPYKHMVFYEMLSVCACLKGQCLRHLMKGNNQIRRQALDSFLNACRHGKAAGNYELIMTAARHYWNTCLPLVNSKLERELLQEPLSTILKCIQVTVDRNKEKEEMKKKSEAQDSAGQVVANQQAASKNDSSPANMLASMITPSDAQKIGDPSEDLTVRAAMYGVLFLSYIDKKEYEAGLQAMDEAVSVMPRTKHRLLIFKHRVMVKAKLGHNVSADIAKFKDESEDYVAYMWRRVALSSKKELEQLTSFQNSIEALTSAANDWQKVDTLFEFGEWLYVNEYNMQDCIDMLDWAINILLNMKFELPKLKPVSVQKPGKSKKGKASASRSKSNLTEDAGKSEGPLSQDESSHPEVEEDESPEDPTELDAAIYIPVVRKSEIGTRLLNLQMTISDVNGITQLEMLARSHVIVATVVGVQSERFTTSCLLAYLFVSRMWQITLGQTKQKEAAGKEGKGSAKKKGDKKEDKRKDADAKDKRVRKCGPVDTVPTSFEDWALYEMPEDVRTQMRNDTTGFTINKRTVTKPELTIHYLTVLADYMSNLQFPHLALPVLSLARLVASELTSQPSLAKIVRLKTIQVCYDIHLNAAAAYHESVIGNLVINEEEQAEMRTELNTMEEKLRQVMMEERRMREQKKVMIEGTSMSSKTKQLIIQRQDSDSLASTTVKRAVGESLILSGRKVGHVVHHENWLQMAHFLVNQCQYQSARQLLCEAHSAGVRFDLPDVRRRALQLLSMMALKEGNPDQAVSLLQRAQDIGGGDLQFWFTATNVLLHATLMRTEDVGRFYKGRELLEYAVREFSQLTGTQPNKRATVHVFLARLRLKLALLEREHIMSDPESTNTMRTRVHKALLALIVRLNSVIELFAHHHQWLDEINTTIIVCSMYRQFANDCHEPETRQDFLLTCRRILQPACERHQAYFKDRCSTIPLNEGEMYNTPYARCVAQLLQMYAETLLDIFAIHVAEEKEKTAERRRKPSLVQFVEEYSMVPATPSPEDEDEEGIEGLVDSIPYTLIGLLQDSLLHNQPINGELLGRTSLLLGRYYNLQGLLAHPDKILQWALHDMHLTVTPPVDQATSSKSKANKTETSASLIDDSSATLTNENADQSADAAAAEQEPPEPEDPKVVEIRERHTARIVKDKRALIAHTILYAQATECLAHSIQTALQSGNYPLAASAALEMVETVGQYDANAASQYLALHQSCIVSGQARELLFLADTDTSYSLLHSLLRQYQVCQQMGTPGDSGHLLASINASLNQFEAWKRTQVKPNHLEFSREYPTDVAMVVLQHSPNKKNMYIGILDKPKGAAQAKGKPSNANIESKARIFKVGVRYEEQLVPLLERVDKYQLWLRTYYLQRESVMSQKAYQARLIATLDDSAKEDPKDWHEGEEEEEAELQKEFEAILQLMEQYLKPVTNLLNREFRPENRDEGVKPSDFMVCMLADMQLLRLPLEALAFLRENPLIRGFSRDFSLQMFHNRFSPTESTDESGDEKKAKGEKGGKNAKTQKESKRPQVKAPSLDREVPNGYLGVDVHSFSYLVDPLNEASEYDEAKPDVLVRDLLAQPQFQAKFAPRWLGMIGNDVKPTTGDWQELLRDCSAFVYYGLESMASYMPVERLLPLSLTDCQLLVMLDRVQSYPSYKRVSKENVHKSERQLSLEQPMKLSLLMTLMGVGTVMLNQWFCKSVDNKQRLNAITKYLIEKGASAGQLQRFMCYPPKEPTKPGSGGPFTQPQPPAAAAASPASAGSGKSGKSREASAGGRRMSIAGGSRPQSSVPKGGKRGSAAPPPVVEEPFEIPPVVYSNFNMTLYGLPNLIIT